MSLQGRMICASVPEPSDVVPEPSDVGCVTCVSSTTSFGLFGGQPAQLLFMSCAQSLDAKFRSVNCCLRYCFDASSFKLGGPDEAGTTGRSPANAVATALATDPTPDSAPKHEAKLAPEPVGTPRRSTRRPSPSCSVALPPPPPPLRLPFEVGASGSGPSPSLAANLDLASAAETTGNLDPKAKHGPEVRSALRTSGAHPPRPRGGRQRHPQRPSSATDVHAPSRHRPSPESPTTCPWLSPLLLGAPSSSTGDGGSGGGRAGRAGGGGGANAGRTR